MSAAKRIGIDARFYSSGAAGLGRYTQELIRYLAEVDLPHTFVVFLLEQDRDEFTIEHPRIEVRTTTTPWYSLREQLTLSRQLAAAKLDLMHFTNFNFPLSYRGRFVISINDLTLLSFAGRGRLSRFKTRPMRVVMQRGANRSRKILTYSEHQKNLIVKNFGVDPDKITVAYLAVDQRFQPHDPAKVAAFRKRHGLRTPFVMYTGQWRQHKNLVRLIKAFRQVRNAMPAKLMLVGKVDSAFPIIPRTVREQKLESDVLFTGFVPDEELPLYYDAADLFVFPSLSEGFGLPPLEAMACGTTVAASQAPPMPEILGEAAAYFDPYDSQSMTAVMQRLLSDPAEREARRENGFAQVQRYSWEETARQTLAAYQAALTEK